MKKIYYTGITALSLIISVGFYSCKTGKKTTSSGSTSSSTTSSSNSTSSSNTATTSNSSSSTALTYTASAKNIITENCSGCHKGMTSYSGIKWCLDNGEFKELVIVKKTMPKGRTLSDADFNILKGWLEAGAPE